MNSIPNLFEFNPKAIPYQYEVIKKIRKNLDYSKGYYEILLSGAAGSAKSLLMAHIGVTHCLNNAGAVLGLGRKAMPDLKDTIFQMIIDHLDGALIEGKDYFVNWTRAQIFFSNGSKIISRSWSDKKFKKWRSIALSAAIIEEASENDDEDKQAIDEIRIRVGRIHHVKEKFILLATNPDSPSHWLYKEFIQNPKPNRIVVYSKTIDNPFLPKQYVEQLKETLDPMLAKRMIDGEWLDIGSEVIYYQYQKDRNFIDESYKVNENFPIRWSWDFNIGDGKPMSTVFFQYINGLFHFFKEIIIDGTRTEEICEEAASIGILDYNTEYIIHGDATGKSKSTRSNFSDYDIIRKFLSNYKNKKGEYIKFQISIPSSNPQIRKRHNTMNALMFNANKEIKLFVYKDCPTLDEGFRLTKLKKGGSYIEDDSKRYQHITTAAGYGVMSTIAQQSWSNPVGMIAR